jgi:glutaredoxin
MLTIYSKNNCPQCDQAKMILTTHGVEFKEIRVDQISEARDFLLAQGHRSVPQIYLNEQLAVPGGVTQLKSYTSSDFQKLKESTIVS